MNSVIDNILSRRSTRAYESKQVPDNHLNQIIEAAKHAPSGKNSQSWLFTVVQNTDSLLELNEAVKAAFGYEEFKRMNYYGSDFSVADDYNFYYHAPTLVIVSAPKAYYNNMADCAVALQNIFLAAHSLGIGSCWINQPAILCDIKPVRDMLDSFGISEEHRVCGCAALGYASKETVPKARKDGNVIILR